MGRNARARFERFYTSESFVRHLGDLFTLASTGWSPLPHGAPVGAGGTEQHRTR
jgi:hypothetical protein